MLQNWLSVISTSCATIAAITAVLALRTSNKQLKANADQYQANYEQDRSDRRRRQAERVTAWVDETHDLQILSNQSGMPVYDAVLTFVMKQVRIPVWSSPSETLLATTGFAPHVASSKN